MTQFKKIIIKEMKENAINNALEKINDLLCDLQETKDDIKEYKEEMQTENDENYIKTNLKELSLLQDKLYMIIDEYLKKGLEK